MNAPLLAPGLSWPRSFYGNRRALGAIRRELRARATPAERRRWTILRGRRLGGAKWRRQYSVGCYVVDFYCPAARLAAELDGAVHDDPLRREADAERQAFLTGRDLRVIRFENRQVFEQLDLVAEALAALLERAPDAVEEGTIAER